MRTHRRMLPLAAILFCGLLLCGCKKNGVDALPPATQTGANTLGCRINGKVWTAQDSDEIFNRYFGVEGGYQAPIIDSIRNCIWIRAKRNDGSSLQLYVEKVNKPGIYALNVNTAIAPNVLFPNSYGYYYNPSGRYVTNSRHTGTARITRADTISKVVSGTFEFQAYDAMNKQIVSITDGRFDARAR